MKEFETEVLGVNERVEAPPRTIQLLPTKLYILPQGSIRNEPSLVWVLSAGDRSPVVVSQISLRMLIESLDRKALDFFKQAIARVDN